MAARRLIALLVVLLVISSIATALAPPPEGGEESSTTSTTTEETYEDEPAAGGNEPGLVEATIDAGGKGSSVRPVQAEVGDQLALSVRSAETSAIEIPALGLYDTAAPGAPALFDVVLREEGELEVLADGKPAGTIAVGSAPGAKAKPGSARQGEPEKRKKPKGQGSRENASSVAA